MMSTTSVGLGDAWANHLLREGARFDRKVPMGTTIITTHTLNEGSTVLAIFRRAGLYYVASTGPSSPWLPGLLQPLDEAVYATYMEAQERLAAEVRERTTEKETTMVRCIYCSAEVDNDDNTTVPAPSDDEAWALLAREHAPDCEWIQTRAHFDGVWHSECYERQEEQRG